jgi:SGT1 protein
MRFDSPELFNAADGDNDDDDSFGGLLNLEPALGTDSVVEYSIYADSIADIAALESLRERLLAMACELVADHIWHRSGFNLSVRQPATGEPHLYGRTDYGDHVDDEWLIVYLLMQATSTFAAESLSICVTDGDGEFMLIEAALVIPPSLSPANSQHRVWLRGGKIHLVLPGHTAAQQQLGKGSTVGRLTVAEGLAALRQAAGSTVASAEVQQAINQKLAEYPAKLQTDRHYARCYLPRAAALVLRRLPSYIAPAVLAYCSREPNEVAVAGAMQRLGGGGCVEDRVRFTRHLYAQLLTAAPVASAKAFPAHWCAADGAPHLTTTARLKAAELGQKVAMGLEILYWRSAALNSSSSSSSTSSSRDTTDAADSAYSSAAAVPASFVHSLEERGYFEGELQGSKRYKEKLALAAQFLQQRDSSSGDDFSDDDQLLLGLAAHMDTATAAATTAGDAAELFARVTEPDDSESWMEVLPSELEQLLMQHNQEPLWSSAAAAVELAAGEEAHTVNATAAANNGGRDTTAAAAAAAASEQLNDMVQGMHAFMEDSQTGLEGAEVPAVGSSISFDVEKFMRLLDGIDDDVAEDDASSDDGANSDTADTITAASGSVSQRKGNVRVGHVQGGRAVHEMLDDDSDDELSPQQQQVSDAPPEPAQTDPADDMAFMQQYVAALEEQLDESSMGESFRQERFKRAAETLARAKVTGPMPLPPGGFDSDDDVDESTAAAAAEYWNDSSSSSTAAAAPVNVDVNMVQQLLESFAAQQGQPGPMSSLLREMGINISVVAAASDSADDDDMVVE